MTSFHGRRVWLLVMCLITALPAIALADYTLCETLTRTALVDLGYGVTAQVNGYGLQPVSGQPCWAGNFDRYQASCAGQFVFKVPPGATHVAITLTANFGIGGFATYTWERLR